MAPKEGCGADLVCNPVPEACEKHGPIVVQMTATLESRDFAVIPNEVIFGGVCGEIATYSGQNMGTHMKKCKKCLVNKPDTYGLTLDKQIMNLPMVKPLTKKKANELNVMYQGRIKKICRTWDKIVAELDYQDEDDADVQVVTLSDELLEALHDYDHEAGADLEEKRILRQDFITNKLPYGGNAKYYLLPKEAKYWPIPKEVQRYCPLICKMKGLKNENFKYLVIMRMRDGIHCFCGDLFTQLVKFDKHCNKCTALAKRCDKVSAFKKGGVVIENNKLWADIEFLSTEDNCKAWNDEYSKAVMATLGYKWNQDDAAVNKYCCDKHDVEEQVKFDDAVRMYNLDYGRWSREQVCIEWVEQNPRKKLKLYYPSRVNTNKFEFTWTWKDGDDPPVPPQPANLLRCPDELNHKKNTTDRLFTSFFKTKLPNPICRPLQRGEPEDYAERHTKHYLKRTNPNCDLTIDTALSSDDESMEEEVEREVLDAMVEEEDEDYEEE